MVKGGIQGFFEGFAGSCFPPERGKSLGFCWFMIPDSWLFLLVHDSPQLVIFAGS